MSYRQSKTCIQLGPSSLHFDLRSSARIKLQVLRQNTNAAGLWMYNSTPDLESAQLSILNLNFTAGGRSTDGGQLQGTAVSGCALQSACYKGPEL